MPELPEVELVARSLGGLVSGRRIAAAELLRERLAPSISANEFARILENASIKFCPSTLQAYPFRLG